MSKTFEGSGFTVIDQVTPYKKEKCIKLLLEMPENAGVEKKLVDFRDEEVKAHISIEGETNQKHAFEAVYTFWMITRHLKNGNVLRIMLTTPYDKPLEKKIIDVKHLKVTLKMESIQKELEFDE